MFSGNINAARCRDEMLTSFLNQLDDDELVYDYFQQDGATAHTTGATIDFLAEFMTVGLLVIMHQTTMASYILWYHSLHLLGVIMYKKNNVCNTLKWFGRIAE